MRFLKKAVSFTRFRVEKMTSELDLAKIQQFAFRELNEESIEESSLGWVNAENPLENSDFQYCSKGEYVVLGIRLDTRRVPYYALQAEFNRALEARVVRAAKEERKEIMAYS